MSDYEFRNKTFDYAPPSRSGGAGGALMLVGGIIALFFLAMLFFGASDGTAPATETGAAAPVVGEETAPAAPAAPAVNQ
ncbi:MAG: hypothetical protein AAF376_02420 [Pseudomonadota bacterium]